MFPPCLDLPVPTARSGSRGPEAQGAAPATPEDVPAHPRRNRPSVRPRSPSSPPATHMACNHDAPSRQRPGSPTARSLHASAPPPLGAATGITGRPRRSACSHGPERASPTSSTLPLLAVPQRENVRGRPPGISAVPFPCLRTVVTKPERQASLRLAVPRRRRKTPAPGQRPLDPRNRPDRCASRFARGWTSSPRPPPKSLDRQRLLVRGVVPCPHRRFGPRGRNG